MREIVAEGQRRGVFRTEPLDETVDALTGFIDGFGVRVLTGMATAEQMTAQATRILRPPRPGRKARPTIEE